MTEIDRATLYHDGYIAGYRGRTKPRQPLGQEQRVVWDLGHLQGAAERARIARRGPAALQTGGGAR